MKCSFILLVALLVFNHSLVGQDIIGMRTKWSDSFREWVILTTDDFKEGTLEMRWASRNDWSEWEFRLGDTIADIRLKWKEDPNMWQIQCRGQLVEARTVWPNDFTEWRISDGTQTLVWKSKYRNILDEWSPRNESAGVISFYTYYERDPREWIWYEELEQDIGIAMRVALMFIAAYHSSPKV